MALLERNGYISRFLSLGSANSGDLKANYPTFYWQVVYSYLVPALNSLKLTQAGQQIVANLYANVFRIEHRKETPSPLT